MSLEVPKRLPNQIPEFFWGIERVTEPTSNSCENFGISVTGPKTSQGEIPKGIILKFLKYLL